MRNCVAYNFNRTRENLLSSYLSYLVYQKPRENQVPEQIKAYKFRIYPTLEQEQYFARCFGAKRFIYNHFLWENKNRFENKEKHLNAFGCSYIITNMKKQEEYSWLKEIDSWVLLNASSDLDRSYKNFFGSFKKKSKIKAKYPRFKKKSNSQSFRTTCKLTEAGLKIPKLISYIKIVQHQEITSKIKTVTISKCPSGKYFASILVEQDIIPKRFTGKEVGLDLGIRDLIITSDGIKFPHPDKIIQKTNELLKNQQRILSRKKPGSNNYEKQRIKVAKLYERITNMKRNYYHEISNYLVTNYDAIYMENLNVSGMLKSKNMARSIHSASWSTLAYMIQYKCDWNHRTFHKISRWFPSSKTCSCCGHKLEKLGRGIKHWTCPECNTSHDRDINAATNIRNQGQKDLYDLIIPTQLGNWDTTVPAVLQKLIDKIERSSDHNSGVNQGREQVNHF